MKSPDRATRPALAVWVLVVLAAPAIARAGGLEYPVQGVHALGRAGAFTAKADDPSALYWNPSRLALLRGTRLLYNHSFVDRRLTFERAPLADEAGATVFAFPAASEQEGFFPLGMSLVVHSDVGLEDWGFALGVVGPTAVGESTFGEAAAAANRYAFVERDILMLFFTAAAAWKYEEWFGFGASLQYAWMPRMRYSLVLVAPGAYDPRDPLSAAQTDLDVRADIDMDDPFGMTLILAAWARPLPCLELGVSARVVPLEMDPEGRVRVEGTSNAEVIAGKGPVETTARLAFTLPAYVQAGVRYVHRDGEHEVFDIEVDFVWEQWSALGSFRLDYTADRMDLWDIGTVEAFQAVVLARNYQDTYSVRLGGQWNVVPDVFTIRLGGLWESAALENAYTTLDFASFERFGVAAGVSVAWHGVELAFSYAHIFQLPRDVAPSEGRIHQQQMYFARDELQMKDRAVVNAGRYESSYDVIAIGLGVHFDALFE